MRETEKKREMLKASRHFFDEQKRSLSYSAPGAYILPQPSKITKKTKTKTKTKAITRDKTGRKPKGDKKSQKSKRSMNSLET